MKTYFEKMFRYERWANGKVLTYLKEQPGNLQLLQIFNHLVADALPWPYLLRGESVPEAVVENMNNSSQWPLEQCKALLDAVQDDLDRCLENMTADDMSKVIFSPGPRGQQYANTVAEVLTHLLSHGQHHRGQIEWLVEKEAGTYLATSYMPYLRQRGKPE